MSDNAEPYGAVRVWDLRMKAGDVTPNMVAKALRTTAKKWAFQLESSENGFVHYQIRTNLVKRKVVSSLKELLASSCLAGAECRRTSGANSRNFNYVMKADTRLRGPWTDQDPDPDEEPMQLMRPPLMWHQQMLSIIANRPSERKIHVIYNKHGHGAKLYFKLTLRYKKLGTIIPPFEKMEDIAQMVMCKPVDRCYVIDVPKGKSLKSDFWSGIEMLKDGYCYDKRNTFRDRVFPTPHIFVLTNILPEMTHLSADRWVIHEIESCPPCQQEDEFGNPISGIPPPVAGAP